MEKYNFLIKFSPRKMKRVLKKKERPKKCEETRQDTLKQRAQPRTTKFRGRVEKKSTASFFKKIFSCHHSREKQARTHGENGKNLNEALSSTSTKLFMFPCSSVGGGGSLRSYSSFSFSHSLFHSIRFCTLFWVYFQL